MRYSCICVLFVVIWAISGWCGAAWAAQTAEFPIGKATVWAIADSTGDRDMSVFSGVEPATLSQYVPSGKTASATMAFLVKIENEIVLIDTGMGTPSGDRASRLDEGLKQVEVAPEQVTLVLITHMHGDHIGGLVKDGTKAFPSARVLSSKVEHDFWLDPKSVELFPNRAGGFEMARNILGLYGPSSQTFDFNSTVAPGILAIDARGHTPGQAAFLLESDGEKILFWGDIVHAAGLQFPRPDFNAQYDMDTGESIVARIRFMEKAAEGKLLIAGSHLPFPAVGTVEKGMKGYVYISR